MSRKEETLTYKQNMSKTEVFHVIKAIGCPLIVFGLGIFTISNFANFGTKLICPAAGIMWFLGFFVALLMPSQRKEVLNQTLIICTVYFCTLLGFKVALGIVSGVSAEMIAASFNQSIPTSTGNAMPGRENGCCSFTITSRCKRHLVKNVACAIAEMVIAG